MSVIRAKKNHPIFRTEDGFLGFKAGFLTLGSSFSQAFPSSSEDSGWIWESSPITVAGAVSVFHGLP